MIIIIIISIIIIIIIIIKSASKNYFALSIDITKILLPRELLIVSWDFLFTFQKV